ncbi:MAG: ferredoxin [Deltaproteobacteria bacterium]|jgi:NAD-dependent dihydropyrimidine dehydrogenase PreA subunit|nr:ferredoxin [Deltaproteobacteria bacterium]
MAFEVIIDKEKCKGCEECLETCTVKVFEMQENKSVPVNVKECLGCQSCVEVCKEKAITVKELEVEISKTTRLLLKDLLSD